MEFSYELTTTEEQIRSNPIQTFVTSGVEKLVNARGQFFLRKKASPYVNL